MSYSEDLRRRVVKFVQDGGSKAEASRVFDVGLRTVFRWVDAGLDAVCGKPGRKAGCGDKLDREALKSVLSKQPDLMLKELAAMFGVSKNAVFHACKTADLPRKKNRHLSRSKVRSLPPRRRGKREKGDFSRGCTKPRTKSVTSFLSTKQALSPKPIARMDDAPKACVCVVKNLQENAREPA